jgi:hypothetical protein
MPSDRRILFRSVCIVRVIEFDLFNAVRLVRLREFNPLSAIGSVRRSDESSAAVPSEGWADAE